MREPKVGQGFSLSPDHPRENPTSGLNGPEPSTLAGVISVEDALYTSMGQRPMYKIKGVTRAESPIYQWSEVTTTNFRSGKLSMNLRLASFVAFMLLCSIPFIGCRKQPERGPHLQDGDDWLSWSPASRESYIKDFFTGYVYGAMETCANANTLFRREGEPIPPTERVDGIDLGTRCQSHIDGFSKFRMSPDQPADISPYADPITAFYKNHPNKRYLQLDKMLLGLRDSTYSEALRNYERVGDIESK